MQKKDFFMRCDWSGLSATRSSIATNTFICDDYRAWAFRYSEQDKEIGSKRYWYTDVGLKEMDGEVIFYARVSYAHGQHDLSSSPEIPQSSVPRFIRYILQGDYKLYSRESAFRLFDKPVPVQNVGTGKAIADLITSRYRHYPLIVFNGNSQALAKEANRLARELAGKCQVILLGDNADLAAEFRTYLPKDLWVSYGKFRVYFRINGLNTNPLRHRFYDIEDAEFADQRKGILNGLLRNHTLEENGCIQNISEIGRLITLNKLHKFRDENPEKIAEVNEVYALVEQIEKERDECKQLIDYFASEYDALQQELHKEQSKNLHYLPSRKLSEQSQERLNFLDNLSGLPQTLIGLVKCFKALFPEKLIFTDRSLDEAADYTAFTDLGAAWEMLYHLCNTLYPIKFNSTKNVDFEKVFEDQTVYSLAMSEGRQTKRDKALMSLRKIIHDDKEYDITPHLKWGNRQPKMLRIHFAFDEDIQKIIVGYIGPHMENATSRTIK